MFTCIKQSLGLAVEERYMQQRFTYDRERHFSNVL